MIRNGRILRDAHAYPRWKSVTSIREMKWSFHRIVVACLPLGKLVSLATGSLVGSSPDLQNLQKPRRLDQKS